MQKFRNLIRYILVILHLTIISLIIYYFNRQNDPLEPPMGNLSRPINIFDINLTMSQDNPFVIEYIQKNHLYPPSKYDYSLDNPESKQLQYENSISTIFNGKRNGIFVEAGACDGEMLSYTMYLEKNYNWTGLLIEPNPRLSQQLLDKHRKAWFADVCISPVPFPQKVNLLQYIKGINATKTWYIAMGVVDQLGPNGETLNHVPRSKFVRSENMTDCFPIFSILSAVGLFEIDFFSLDIEGLEMKVIKTIPFDMVNIKVFLVEVNHIIEGREELIKFMKSKGYYSPPINAGPIDLIFIKNGYTVGNIN